MTRMVVRWAALRIVLILTAMASPLFAQSAVYFQTPQTWSFPTDGVSFSNDFSGARLNEVTRTASNTYRLSITPETTPINDSPWYAFKVWASSSRTVTLTLVYTSGTHRYRPKVSTNNGTSWYAISSSLVTENTGSTEATFPTTASTTVRTVAGQAMITVEDQMNWTQALTRLPFVQQSEIGRSVENRSIPRFDVITAPASDSQTLIIMTGQHPPETTSVQAFRSFIDTLLADTPLARKFRRRFNLAVFPLMNPDGWHHGHWRTNANGIDINRTWSGDGDPSAPEVQQAIRSLRAITKPVAFVDFHSTSTNIFYTGTDDAEQPSYFVPTFLTDLAQKVPDWTWDRSTNTSGEGSSSRSWVATELGIPSLTWEWSDAPSTDRMILGPVAGAESMMTLLLKLWQDKPAASARYNFESPASPGLDSMGTRHASLTGSPTLANPAAVGDKALSLAGTASYLTLPDFNYASTGTALSFWFKMDASSLVSGTNSVTYLYSHGDPSLTNQINIYYYRKSSPVLRIRVRDLNDASDEIDLPSSLFLGDGKWHHLGLLIQQATGTTVYLDGVMKDSMTHGKDGINPSGLIHLGIRSDQSSTTQYRGLIDDLQIHNSILTPYELSTIRHQDAPREPYLTWKAATFLSMAFGESNLSAADTADPDGDGLNNLAEYALGSDPRTSDAATRAPRMTRNLADGSWVFFYPRRRQGTGSSGLGWSAESISYQVWTSSDLSNWASGENRIAEPAPATPLNADFDWISSSALSPPTPGACFYRVEIKRIGN